MSQAKRWILGVMLSSLLAPSGTAADAETAADIWLKGESAYPGRVATSPADEASFVSLKAEAIIGKLKVSFPSAGSPPGARVTLFSSVDEPGHWPARDWNASPMKLRGRDWSANLPVDAPDVPVVYFVESVAAGRTNVSPMRVCRPRKLGIEKPSRAFWFFLDGFEAGTERWRYLSGSSQTGKLRAVTESRSGLRALAVSVPPGKVSVTVGTTAVRGWHAQLKGATGLQFWARTAQGKGKVRLTLLANAFAEEQGLSILPQTIGLSSEWKKVEVFFSEFPKLNIPDVDLLSLEFIGASETEFRIDDLRLAGSRLSF